MTTKDVWLRAELTDHPGGGEEVLVWVYTNDGVTKLARVDPSVRDLGLLATGRRVLSEMVTFTRAET